MNSYVVCQNDAILQIKDSAEILEAVVKIGRKIRTRNARRSRDWPFGRILCSRAGYG